MYLNNSLHHFRKCYSWAPLEKNTRQHLLTLKTTMVGTNDNQKSVMGKAQTQK